MDCSAARMIAAVLLGLALNLPGLADEPVAGDATPLYAGTQPQQNYVPLATAGPARLPPLSAVGNGCCLEPCVSCPGPPARFCEPPLYYGTNPLDDDWTNPLLQCAGGQCGQVWYRYARASVRWRSGFTQRVHHPVPHAH